MVLIGEHSFTDFVAFATAFYSHPSNADTKIVALAQSLIWSDKELMLFRGSDISRNFIFIRGLPLNHADRERVAVR